jgi:hypothetical protein
MRFSRLQFRDAIQTARLAGVLVAKIIAID